MKCPFSQSQIDWATTLCFIVSLVAFMAPHGILRAADIPPIGTILTNTVRHADGSTVTKRYRVTTGVLHRDAQVSSVDPERRKFPVSVNEGGTGTHITDLPPKVLVIKQKGILRVFGNPDADREGWPKELTHIYSQVSSLSEFLVFGSKAFVPPETRDFQIVPAPITHSGVEIRRRDDLSGLDKFFFVSVDYLSGIVEEKAERSAQYIIADGTDVVVSGSITGSPSGFGGQVLGSPLSASPSAHGVLSDFEWTGFVEIVTLYLERPMYNACWGAEFIGVEEMTDTIPAVMLAGRMVVSGFEVSFSPALPVTSQLEWSTSLPGVWSTIQDVAAGVSSILVEAERLPTATTFFRINAKP